MTSAATYRTARFETTVAVALVLAVGILIGSGGRRPLFAGVIAFGVTIPILRRLGGSASATAGALAGAAGTGAAIAVLNLYAPADPSARLRLLGSVVIAMGLAPSLAWIADRRKGVPLLPALGALYAVYFGAPIFLRQALTRWDYSRRVIPDEAISAALVLSLLGMACLYCGFAVGARHRMPWARSTLGQMVGRLTASPGPAVVVAVLGVAVYALRTARPPGAGVVQFVDLAASGAVLGSLALYLHWAHTGRHWAVAALLVILSFRLLMGFGTGLNYEAFGAVLPLLLLACVVRRRLLWRLALVGLVMLAVLQPVKTVYRAQYWRSSSTSNPIAAGNNYLQTAGDVVTSDVDWRDTVDEFMGRFGYLMTFAEVVEKTPSTVPYWGGHTLLPILTKPLPRAVWPGKPEEVSGQTFGHRYSLLGPGDHTTAYNMPQLVEFYANFGATGVALGMFLLGFALALLLRLLAPSPGDWAAAAAACYVLSPMLLIESATSSVAALTLYRFLALWGVALLAAHRPRHAKAFAAAEVGV